MRIINEKGCFLEREDLKFGHIPRNIQRYVPNEVFSGFMLLSSKKAEDYFKNCDYIIDYEAICDLSNKELDEKINETKNNIEKLSLKFYEAKNHESVVYNLQNQIQKLNFMLETLERYKNNKYIIDEDANEVLDKKRMY